MPLRKLSHITDITELQQVNHFPSNFESFLILELFQIHLQIFTIAVPAETGHTNATKYTPNNSVIWNIMLYSSLKKKQSILRSLSAGITGPHCMMLGRHTNIWRHFLILDICRVFYVLTLRKQNPVSEKSCFK
jgi:hypothetical protein